MKTPVIWLYPEPPSPDQQAMLDSRSHNIVELEKGMALARRPLVTEAEVSEFILDLTTLAQRALPEPVELVIGEWPVPLIEAMAITAARVREEYADWEGVSCHSIWEKGKTPSICWMGNLNRNAVEVVHYRERESLWPYCEIDMFSSEESVFELLYEVEGHNDLNKDWWLQALGEHQEDLLQRYLAETGLPFPESAMRITLRDRDKEEFREVVTINQNEGIVYSTHPLSPDFRKKVQESLESEGLAVRKWELVSQK